MTARVRPWIRSAGDAERAWDAIGREPAVAEAGVDFDAEFSRHRRALGGRTRTLSGIRRTTCITKGSCAPRPSRAATSRRARSRKRGEAALRIAEALDHVGVLTVEFFASDSGPVVNEIAPRVHNSGHWTIEGAVTSQFEQHIRAICGLRPADRARRRRRDDGKSHRGGGEPMARLIAEEGAHVHIYGKGEARPGRKMGHVTRVCR